MIAHLITADVLASEHGTIEKYIEIEGYELLRLLLQGYLDARAENETRLPCVVDSQGQNLTHCRTNNKTTLTSLFGDVAVKRKGYSLRKTQMLFPLDGELNLAEDQFSDGVRLRLAEQISDRAYDQTVSHINLTTGAKIAKRQSINIVQDITQDFEHYYLQQRYLKPENTNDLLVLTFDGKGIVMRPDSLRECTKKRAGKQNKLSSRLSSGEKKDRKRMAQVASVYTVLPHQRSAELIMKCESDNVRPIKVPARNKRVWASVERDAVNVIEEAFKEALQRDPKQLRQWVVLIDGHPAQRKMIEKTVKKYQVNITVVLDFIHVLEYLWKAAWCFFKKGDEAVEKWVANYALKILKGHSSQVAKGLRQSATKRKLSNRKSIDICAKYLLTNKTRLRYDVALEGGFPIASGIIEGACRHLINDRLDITGARWGLEGAEALLKLRSLHSSGDFNQYWDYHKQQSKQRLYPIEV